MERDATVRCAGDRLWIRRWVGVSIAPQVGSIYNEAIWDSTTQPWHNSQQRRTLQRDADHHRQDLRHGHSQHAGCVGKRLTRMALQHIFMCILHCIMAVGRWRCSSWKPYAVTWIRYCKLVSHPSWTGHAPGYAWALLPPWMGRSCTAAGLGEGTAAYLDATHPVGRTVVEMRALLRHLYRTYKHGPAPHCRGPSTRFREHVAAKSGSHYLLFLEEDCDDVLAAVQPHSMVMMRQDIVESVNRILEVGYNDHLDCGAGCAEHPTLREARVVAQVWEWWFLQFNLPLYTRGVPNTISCVVSNLMEPVVHLPPPIPKPRSPPPPAFFQHGRKRRRGDDCQEQHRSTSKNGMLLLAFVCISWF